MKTFCQVCNVYYSIQTVVHLQTPAHTKKVNKYIRAILGDAADITRTVDDSNPSTKSEE